MSITVTPLDPQYSATQRFQVHGAAVGDTITAAIVNTAIARVSPGSQIQTSAGVIFTVSGTSAGGTSAIFTDATTGDSEARTVEIAGAPVPSPATLTLGVGDTVSFSITEQNDPNAFPTVQSGDLAVLTISVTTNANGEVIGTVTGVGLGSSGINYDDGHGGSGSIGVVVAASSTTPILAGAPDVRITVYDHAGELLELDASADVGYTGITYTDTQNGPDACTIELAEYYEDVIHEGVWTARNIVEISVADDALQQPVSAGATKIYVGSRGGYDPKVGHDSQQIYLYDGTNLAMRLPVTLVDTDSGGDFLELGAAIPYAFATGTLVGRRRYCGIIARREMQNAREPHQTISCIGMFNRLADFNDSFTADNYDAGSCIYAVLSKIASDCPELSIIQSHFPVIGMTYSGTRERSSVDQIVAEILTGVDNGDQWVVRVGHDRIVRLVKLYDSASNTYTYNVTIPQNQTPFLVGNVRNVDQDARQMFNWIEVLGDTDPITKQPVAAIVVDAIDSSGNPVPGSSYDIYGKIEGNPVTNNALKTVDACASYGRGLLNEFSLPRQNSSFTLHARNTARETGAAPEYTGYSSASFTTNGALALTGKWWNIGASAPPSGGGDLLATPNATSTDALLDYDLGSWATDATSIIAPLTMGAGNVYARFTGTFTPNVSGTWRMGLAADDGSNLIVNGVHLVSALGALASGGNHTYGSGWSGTIALTAGVPVSVVVEYFNNNDTTYGIQLLCTPPSASSVQLVGGPGTPVTVSVVSYPALLQGDVVLGVQNVVLTGFDSPAPNLNGICQVAESKVFPGRDKQQQVTFSAVEPDHNAQAQEHAFALATASRQNTSPPAYLTQYCVSADAFDFTPSVPFTGFTLSLPLFNAVFARPSGTTQGAVVLCGGRTLTLVPSATNYVYLTSDATFHIVTNDPTPIASAIFYGIFQTDGTSTIGFWAKASVGLNLPNPANLPGAFGVNLIPDSQWSTALFNSNGIAANDPNWSFNWIDGLSFGIGKGGDANGDNYLFVRPGDSPRDCSALCKEIDVVDGDYVLSCYIDAGTAQGASPQISIVDASQHLASDPATYLFTVSQAPGARGRVQGTWTNAGATKIKVFIESNQTQINADILVFSQPQLEVGDTMTGFKPSTTGSTGSNSTAELAVSTAISAGQSISSPEVIVGDTSITAGNGPPGDIAKPKGSLYLENDTPDVWQSLGESSASSAGFIDPPQYVSGASDVVIIPRTAVQPGDVLVFIGSGAAFPGTISTDWTQILAAAGGVGFDGAQAAYHVVLGGESAPFVAISQAENAKWWGVLYHLTNVAAASFIDASETAVNQSAPYTDATLTSASVNDLALSFVSAGRTVLTQSAVSSGTNWVQDVLAVDASNAHTVVGAHQRFASSGASVANTTTLDAAATNVVSVLVLVKPGTGTSTIGSWEKRAGTHACQAVLCSSDFTPSATGADVVVVQIPPDPDTGASVSWTVEDIFLRVETAASSGTTSVKIQRSTASGAFVNAGYLNNTSVDIASGSFEGSMTSAFTTPTVNSGDKLRAEYTAIGTGAAGFSCYVLLKES